MIGNEKRSSLFCHSIIYEDKKFDNIDTLG
jgi:hypothetical protein